MTSSLTGLERLQRNSSNMASDKGMTTQSISVPVSYERELKPKYRKILRAGGKVRVTQPKQPAPVAKVEEVPEPEQPLTEREKIYGEESKARIESQMETKTLQGETIGEFAGSRGVPEDVKRQWHEARIASQEQTQRKKEMDEALERIEEKQKDIEQRFYDRKPTVSPEQEVTQTTVTGETQLKPKPGVFTARRRKAAEAEYEEMVRQFNEKFYWIDVDKAAERGWRNLQRDMAAGRLTVPGGAKVDTSKVQARLNLIQAGEEKITLENINVVMKEVKETGWGVHKALTADTTTEMFRNVPQADMKEYVDALAMQKISQQVSKFEAKQRGKQAVVLAGYTVGTAAAGEVIGTLALKGGTVAKVAKVVSSPVAVKTGVGIFGASIISEEIKVIKEYKEGQPIKAQFEQEGIIIKTAGVVYGAAWLKATKGKPISKLYEKTVTHPLAERKFRIMEKELTAVGQGYEPPREPIMEGRVQATLKGYAITQKQVQDIGLTRGFKPSFGQRYEGKAPTIKVGDVRIQRQIITEGGRVTGFSESVEQGMIPKIDPSKQTRLMGDIIVGRAKIDYRPMKVTLGVEEYEYTGSMALNKALIVPGQQTTVLHMTRVNQHIPEWEGVTMLKTISPQSPVYGKSFTEMLRYQPPEKVIIGYAPTPNKYDVTAFFYHKQPTETQIQDIITKLRTRLSKPRGRPAISFIEEGGKVEVVKPSPKYAPEPTKAVIPASKEGYAKAVKTIEGGTMTEGQLLSQLEKYDPYLLSGDRLRTGQFMTEPLMVYQKPPEPESIIATMLPPVVSVGAKTEVFTLTEPITEMMVTRGERIKFESEPVMKARTVTETRTEITPVYDIGRATKAATATEPVMEQITEPITEPIIEPVPPPLPPPPPITRKPPPPKPPREPPPPVIDIPRPKPVVWPSAGTGKRFYVLVRRKGKFFRISPKPLIEREAIQFGAFKVGTTAAATFKLEPTEEQPGMRFTGKGFLKDFYRKGSLWIEKRGRRISTPGELREITFKGLAAIKGKQRNPKQKSFKRFKGNQRGKPSKTMKSGRSLLGGKIKWV